MMKKSFAQKVREAVSELGEFTIDELSNKLNVQAYKDNERLRLAVKSLRKHREIISIKRGLYKYQGKQKPLVKIARIWRAMRIKVYFTLQDVVRLSGASESHARKYIKYLIGKGFVEHVTGKGYTGKLYRLVDPDNAPLEHPKLDKKKR